MNKYLFILLAVLSFVYACQEDEAVNELNRDLEVSIKGRAANGQLDYYILPESDDYANLPFQDPANPMTEAKVRLGNLLFFETGLAQSPKEDICFETYSCSTCHLPTAGFLPGRNQGIADGAAGYGENGEFRTVIAGYLDSDLDAQGTRPMNTLNAGYSTVMLWSGSFGALGPNEGTEDYWTGLAEANHSGYIGLEAQNIVNFDFHRMAINAKVLDTYGYRALYDEAFPDFPESERYSQITTSFAVSAFIRSFLANRAPFQQWLKGDSEAMTVNQKEGAMLFFGKARCAGCHSGPALSSMTFHALGTADLYETGALNTGPDDPSNLGRGRFTGKTEDMRAFKVPQLYNVKDYVTYFHGSSKTTLEDVIDFKIKASSENPDVANENISDYFKPIELSIKERDDLLDFLRNGLYDAEFERYVPKEVLSGNCFPNNDVLSQKDLGCR